MYNVDCVMLSIVLILMIPMGTLMVPLYARCRGLQVNKEIYSGCYMESGQLRSLDIRNTYPHLDPDPRKNLPMSSRVPVRRVVVQSGPDRVGTQSGDNYSAGRYPDVLPSSPRVLKFFGTHNDV